MQVLLGIPGICAAIFDERNVLDLNRSPIPALRDFADSYRASSNAVTREDTHKFRQALLNLKIVQSISGQEDSGEALTRLYSLYNFPRSSPFISTISSYVAFEKKDLVQDKSGKDDYFDATCSDVDRNLCRTGAKVEPTPLVPLSLPLVPKASVELDEIFQLSFHRESRNSPDEPLRVRIAPNPLQGAIKFEHVKDLAMAPQLLLNMQLESYDMHHDEVRKRDDKIKVHSKWRGMTLMGISQHLGGDNVGHYIAFKKRCTKSGGSSMEWIKYDDDRTSLHSTSTALEAAAEGKLLYFAKDPQLPSCESLEFS
jgi:hypothetical protein